MKKLSFLFVAMLNLSLIACAQSTSVDAKAESQLTMSTCNASGYTVTWKNYDGKTLETDSNVSPGTFPHYDSPTPVKPDSKTKRYVFSGWDPLLTSVTNADQVYTAQFTEVGQTYKINISCTKCSVNGKSNLIESRSSDDLPLTYHFALPSGRFVHDYPDANSVEVKVDGALTTEGYTYNEKTGDITITQLLGDMDITATGDYSSANLTYLYDSEDTVTLKFNDETSVEVDWGDGSSKTTQAPYEHTYSGTEGDSYRIKVYCNVNESENDVNYFVLADESAPLSKGNMHISEVNMLNTFRSIPEYAFNGCEGLTKIKINPEIESIATSNAFRGNINLTTIEIDKNNTWYNTANTSSCIVDSHNTLLLSAGDQIIPEGVTSIGANAFVNPSLITSVNFPLSLTTIGANAFANAVNLTNVNISPNVETIQSLAFFGCESISLVDLSQNTKLTSVGEGAFKFGYGVSDVFVLPKDRYDDYYRILNNVGYGDYVVKLEDIPTVSIEYDASERPKPLFSVTAVGGDVRIDWGDGSKDTTVPNDPTRHDSCNHDYSKTPFSGICTINFYASVQMTCLEFLSNSAIHSVIMRDGYIDSTISGESAFEFDSDYNLEMVVMPNTITKTGTLKNCSLLSSVVIGSQITEIASSCFQQTSLASINIPSNVKKIGSYAFSSCSQLSSVTFHDGLLEISKNAFAGCDIKQIDFPSSLTTLGDNVYDNNPSLTSVYLPASLTSIGSNVFSKCPLTSLIVSPKNEKYDSRDNCNAVIETKTDTLVLYCSSCSIIPNTVKNIGDSLFKSDKTITSLDFLSDSIEMIGASAFASCTSLVSARLPSSLKSLGNLTFSGCSALREVIFPEDINLKTIGQGAFMRCSSLTTITLPEGLESLGANMFMQCSSLTTLTLPSSIKDIAASIASSSCPLVDVYCYAIEPPTAGNKMFSTATPPTIHVPADSLESYKVATNWSNYAANMVGDL